MEAKHQDFEIFNLNGTQSQSFIKIGINCENIGFGTCHKVWTCVCGLALEKFGFQKIYLTDEDEVIEKITRPNILLNESLNCEGIGLNWNTDRFNLSKTLETSGMLCQPLDLITASDVIFNMTQIELVPQVLRLICEIYLEKFQICPIILMSYKSRNEQIDDKLFEAFDKNNFEGEQANAKELEEEMLSLPIDVFIFKLKESKVSIILPSYTE
ncbi:UNKNOWN [Stylonychia lemnae]|uniref:Uncharacterized protein n=1 Tax=Stylonychia lemnae TaxID=5949 RepID=A0A078AUD1_STYLE|nr:UNKNOWN [Stylonychia lemnae]|eukprot:CDW84458.1 UNKNOWN [Stylonychia lemnae]